VLIQCSKQISRNDCSFRRLASTINWQRVRYKTGNGPGAGKFGQDKKMRAAVKGLDSDRLAGRPLPGNSSGQFSKVEC
jgi:hypothetical protein